MLSDDSPFFDDLSAERVLGYFFLQHLETPPADPTFIELTPPLQEFLELRQNSKDIVLFIVDVPLRMALD